LRFPHTVLIFPAASANYSRRAITTATSRQHVSQLLEMATANGIDGANRLRKQELILPC
jgi:hypothetical protein